MNLSNTQIGQNAGNLPYIRIQFLVPDITDENYHHLCSILGLQPSLLAYLLERNLYLSWSSEVGS